MLPFPSPRSLKIIPCYLSLPADEILINQEPFQPDWATGVDLIRADAHLGTEPKPHPVRHARACVPEDAGAVDTGVESLRCLARGSYDGIGVRWGVGVDVRDSEIAGCGERRDGFHGEDEVEEFGAEVFLCGVLYDGGLMLGEGGEECGFGRGVAAEGDAVLKECFCYSGEEGGEYVFVDEEGFYGVAGCWVADFGIDKDFDGHFGLCVSVDINIAETVCVPENRDTGVIFYIAHELVWTTGNDEIYVPIQVKQWGHDVSSRKELDRGIWDSGRAQGLWNHGGNRNERFCRLFAPCEWSTQCCGR